MNVRKEQWVPTFRDQAPICFVADARLRRNMLVCLHSFLFLMQSDQSTEFRRSTVGTRMINDVGPSVRHFKHVLEELGIHN